MQGIKAKGPFWASIIMIVLFLALIALATFRMLTRSFDLIFIIYAGIDLIVLFYLVKEIINLFKYLFKPTILIEVFEDSILIKGKTDLRVEKTDIEKVSIKGISKFFLFSNPCLVINTKNQVYHIFPIKNIEDIIENLK